MDKKFITVEEFGKREFIHLNKSEIAYFYANPDFKQNFTEEDSSKKELAAMTVMLLKNGEKLFLFNAFEDLRKEFDFPYVMNNSKLRFRIIQSFERDQYLVEFENGRIGQKYIDEPIYIAD